MISWVAMNRMVERVMASDAKLRKEVAGRPLRSHAKRLTDEELLARLGIAQILGFGPRKCHDSFEFVFAGRPRQTSLLQTEIPELLKFGTFVGEVRLYTMHAIKPV
jgi:hypothetical protein